MQRARRWLNGIPVVVTAVALLASPAVHARLMGGVTMEETRTVGSATVKLNGMAIRKKFIVNVYVGGLYLAAPARKAEDVVSPDTPKVLVMHFVHDVGRGKLLDAYRDGLANNSPADKQKAVKADFEKFLAAVPDVADGQRITFTYEPGKGSTVELPNKKTVTVPGKDFADAYLLMFVGRDPPTDGLKNGLLLGR